MGKSTVLSAEEFDLGTGAVLAAIRTAAAGSNGAHVRVKRLEISQNGTVTGEMIRGEIATRDTAGTLTMTATTPRNIQPVGGGASGLTGNTAPAGGDGRSGTNSSADSGGTYTSLWPFSFHNLNGHILVPTSDEEIWIPPSTVAVVRLLATPASALDWGVVWVLEEF